MASSCSWGQILEFLLKFSPCLVLTVLAANSVNHIFFPPYLSLKAFSFYKRNNIIISWTQYILSSPPSSCSAGRCCRSEWRGSQSCSPGSHTQSRTRPSRQSVSLRWRGPPAPCRDTSPGSPATPPPPPGPAGPRDQAHWAH